MVNATIVDVKTALVLSAGGMFGAYQAGVWKALYPVFRPDMVIGVSVGSINGWAIASGISGDELAGIWLDPRCAELMCPHTPRRPWRTYFDPAPLEQMVREMTSTYTPQVPFIVSVTRMRRLRLEFFRTPDVTWRHLMASCAVPFGFPPVRLNGPRYVDGGLMSVMPVWAAPQFGADRAVAVNVLPSMPLNILRASVRMVRLLGPREPEAAGLEVLRLGPPRVLGTLRQALSWDKAVIRDWIARGQNDADALLASPSFSTTENRFV